MAQGNELFVSGRMIDGQGWTGSSNSDVVACLNAVTT
jgi:hypothetical protein